MRRRRLWIVFALLVVGLAVIEARLVRLQLVERELWARESRRSTMTFRSWPFERGWILDRNGEPIAMSEPVRELVFRFGDWRKRSALGQACLALWLVDGHRRELPGLDRDLAGALDVLGAVRVDTVAALPGAYRRTDLIAYLEWLLGEPFARALRVELAEPERTVARLADVPSFASGRRAALERHAREHAALADLARAAGLAPDELLERVSDVVRDADRRAAARVGSARIDGETFKAHRDAHAWIDYEDEDLAGPVDFDTETLVAIRGAELPGFSVLTRQRRTYPPELADVAVNLIGRVGLPSRGGELDRAREHRRRLADLAAIDADLTAEELAEYERLRVLVREVDYLPDEEKGVLGLEAALEPLLRGKRGWIASARDPDDADSVEVESAPPQRGLNVTLTLDMELQRAAERVLDETEIFDEATGARRTPPGAIALVDPRDGAILALASSPRPTRDEVRTDYARLAEDPARPLEHRGLGAGNLPPPGSTFKPIAALAMLELGVLTPESRFTCERWLTVGRDHRKKCLGRHGSIDLRSAIEHSCNVYFYKASLLSGGEPLIDMAARFGLGEPTGLLENEVLASRGIVLDGGLREVAGGVAAERLTDAVCMQLAVGQHPLDDVTPLQVAVAMGAIGTGRRVPPSILESVEGWGPLPPRRAVPLGVSNAHLRVVREGMERVVDSGSARPGLIGDPTRPVPEEADAVRRHWAARLAGKTGTPEVAGRRDHAWFAGYLPRESPRLAFAVFLEHPGLGGSKAAVPTFRRLLETPEMAAFLGPESAP